MTIVSANVPGFRLLQRNRPIRLQLAQPRREFCLRELRGTKPVRRQTSLILANFSQSETLSATSQLIFSLYLSLEQDGGLLCLYVFSLASSPQLFTREREGGPYDDSSITPDDFGNAQAPV